MDKPTRGEGQQDNAIREGTELQRRKGRKFSAKKVGGFTSRCRPTNWKTRTERSTTPLEAEEKFLEIAGRPMKSEFSSRTAGDVKNLRLYVEHRDLTINCIEKRYEKNLPSHHSAKENYSFQGATSLIERFLCN